MAIGHVAVSFSQKTNKIAKLAQNFFNLLKIQKWLMVLKAEIYTQGDKWR